MSIFPSLSVYSSFCYPLSLRAAVEHQSSSGVAVRFIKSIAGWSWSKAYALNLSDITTHYQLEIRTDAVCPVPARSHDQDSSHWCSRWNTSEPAFSSHSETISRGINPVNIWVLICVSYSVFRGRAKSAAPVLMHEKWAEPIRIKG